MPKCDTNKVEAFFRGHEIMKYFRHILVDHENFFGKFLMGHKLFFMFFPIC